MSAIELTSVPSRVPLSMATTAPVKSTIKVLVVEDREDDFRYLTFLLGRNGLDGYQLDWASTYALGRQKLRAGGFDVALFDYHLGQQTGIDLLREAQEFWLRDAHHSLDGQ